MGRRLNWIDYAKGLIIVALVYGHALSSGRSAGLEISPTFQSLCYATLSNMIPLFFFLAGVFVPKSYETRSTKSFLVERLQRVAYPYFVWSILQGLAVLFAGGQPGNGSAYDTLLAIPYRPFDQFWFLYALVWMAPIYVLSRRFGRASSFALAAISIVLFAFPVTTTFLGLEMLSIHLIFFAAGALASPYVVGDRQLGDLPFWATLASTVLFVGSSLYIYTQWLDAATGTANHMTHRGVYLYLGVLAGVATTGWAQLFARRKWFGIVEFLGKYSLQIFVAHMFGVVAVRVIAQKLFGASDPYLVVGGGIVAGLAGPVVLALLTDRFGLPNLFEIRSKKRARRPAAGTQQGPTATPAG